MQFTVDPSVSSTIMFVEDQSSHTWSNIVECASDVKKVFGKKLLRCSILKI